MNLNPILDCTTLDIDCVGDDIYPPFGDVDLRAVCALYGWVTTESPYYLHVTALVPGLPPMRSKRALCGETALAREIEASDIYDKIYIDWSDARDTLTCRK